MSEGLLRMLADIVDRPFEDGSSGSSGMETPVTTPVTTPVATSVVMSVVLVAVVCAVIAAVIIVRHGSSKS